MSVLTIMSFFFMVVSPFYLLTEEIFTMSFLGSRQRVLGLN
jgi:hypothetical protein